MQNKQANKSQKLLCLVIASVLMLTACKKDCEYDSSIKEDDPRCVPPTTVIPDPGDTRSAEAVK